MGNTMQPINTNTARESHIRTMQHIGGQQQSVRKADLNPSKSSDRPEPTETFSHSELQEAGEKAGLMTGMTAQFGKKTAGTEKKDDAQKLDSQQEAIQERQPESLSDSVASDAPNATVSSEQTYTSSSETLSQAMSNLSPRESIAVAADYNAVASLAEKLSKEGAPLSDADKEKMLAALMAGDPELKGNAQLSDAAAQMASIQASNPGTMGPTGIMNAAANTAAGVTTALGSPTAGGGLPIASTPGSPGSMGPDQPVMTQPQPPVDNVPPPTDSTIPTPTPTDGTTTPPPMGPETPATPAQGKNTEIAAQHQALQQDLLDARKIYAQMAAERQKWMMQIWEIMQDTQTKIMEILQTVTARRFASFDAMAQTWDKVLGEFK